ncbi:MAG: hypothetical protein Q7T05_02880, partial [Dehalococcoidia bacterium]|nr:hypothetical protein [Dehalococcoidia bacterium]
RASDFRRVGGNNYHSYDYDVTLKEMAEKEAWRVKQGVMLRPPRSFYFKSGLSPQVRLRSTSAYNIREVGEGNFALYEGEERVEDICFYRPKPRTTPEPVTGRGTPISTLIAFWPCCFFLNPMHRCEYFSTGDQCKFCNYNAAQDDARAAGLDVPVTRNLEETIEAFKIRNSEVRQLEGVIQNGGFQKAEQESRIHYDFVEKLASAASNKPNLSLAVQAKSRKEMQRLKDAGLDCCGIQMEVMDPKLFPEICPGKAKRTPFEGYIEACLDAVDIFGVGNVKVPLISGITLLTPNGHNTWQEARDYHIEANDWLIKNGILAEFYPLWWAPGSVISEDKSNLQKLPPIEYHLEIALAHHGAMLKYGLYEKMNKLMVCGLDLPGPYAGDIGMLTLAGDVGKWMSTVVPDEENWLAELIAPLQSLARTHSEIHQLHNDASH